MSFCRNSKMKRDIVKNLLVRHQLNFLIDVFIQLDVRSLSHCLHVSQVWRDFLVNYLLKGHRRRILRRAWRELSSDCVDDQEITLRGSICDVRSSGEVLYASFTSGKYDKIGENNQLEDQAADTEVLDILTCSSKVSVGGDIELIEILGRSKVKDEVSTRVLVKWKDSDKVIYKAEITKENITTSLCGRSVFLRKESFYFLFLNVLI